MDARGCSVKFCAVKLSILCQRKIAFQLKKHKMDRSAKGKGKQVVLYLGADWATWLPGICQVDRLVRRPSGPQRKMLQ